MNHFTLQLDKTVYCYNKKSLLLYCDDFAWRENVKIFHNAENKQIIYYDKKTLL